MSQTQLGVVVLILGGLLEPRSAALVSAAGRRRAGRLARVSLTVLLLPPGEPMSVDVGQVLDGKYRVVRLIGRGGAGSVFEGEHILIERRVAIKVLHSKAPEMVARFVREGRAAGRIGNDHILEILDVGSLPDGSPYMVAELLEGETLSQRLRRQGCFAVPDAAALVVELLDGIGAAHRAGVVHRDLKPDNIFLVRHKAGRRDFVKIIDFGISKFYSGAEAMSLTRTGQVVGTPYYLAPEQARDARKVDARSDLYAVGAILYQLVTTRIPFEASSLNELLVKISSQSPPPPTRWAPRLDPAFSALILRAMARDPADRFQTAQEFEQALRLWLLPDGTRTSVLPSLAPTQPPPASLVQGSVPPARLPPMSFGSPGVPSSPVSVPPTPTSSEVQVGPTLLSASPATASAFGRTRSESPSPSRPLRRVLLAAGASIGLLAIGFFLVAAWLGRARIQPVPEVSTTSCGVASVVVSANAASRSLGSEVSIYPAAARGEPRVEPANSPTAPAPAAPTLRPTPRTRVDAAPSALSSRGSPEPIHSGARTGHGSEFGY